VFGGRIRAMMLPVVTERHADLPMRILYRALANRMRDQIKLRTDGSIPFKTKCLGL